MNKNKKWKIYFIEFSGTSGNGYVSYDNGSCNSLDMAMLFDNEEEAIKECQQLQKEWKSKLKVSFCEILKGKEDNQVKAAEL